MCPLARLHLPLPPCTHAPLPIRCGLPLPRLQRQGVCHLPRPLLGGLRGQHSLPRGRLLRGTCAVLPRAEAGERLLSEHPGAAHVGWLLGGWPPRRPTLAGVEDTLGASCTACAPRPHHHLTHTTTAPAALPVPPGRVCVPPDAAHPVQVLCLHPGGCHEGGPPLRLHTQLHGGVPGAVSGWGFAGVQAEEGAAGKSAGGGKPCLPRACPHTTNKHATSSRVITRTRPLYAALEMTAQNP